MPFMLDRLRGYIERFTRQEDPDSLEHVELTDREMAEAPPVHLEPEGEEDDSE